MNGALARKELRELLPWGVLSFAFGLLEMLTYFASQVDMLPLGATFALLNHPSTILYWLLAFAIGTGLATRERDDRTVHFLDGLPVSRSRVFLVKCAVMAALALLAPAIRVASITVMHLLSRGSLDHDLNAGLLLEGFGLQAGLVVSGLMLGAALGRLRSLTWLVTGMAAAALILLEERYPRAAVLHPLSLLDWEVSSAGLIVGTDTVWAQIVIATAAFLVAWHGFVRADRSSRLRIAHRPFVGALLTIATVGVVLAVLGLYALRLPDVATAAPGPPDGYRFAPSPPADTVTRHYRFSYPANQSAAALGLAAEADAIFERVHDLLGVPLGERIDVDASGSAVNTHGTAYFGRVRMTLDSEVAPVLAHETAHVVAQRHAGDRNAWLWDQAPVLNEGLATWVEMRFRAAPSSDDRMLMLAALHARRELLVEELAAPALLSERRDERMKYAAGEALIAAMVRLYGEAAPARLLNAFADPRLAADLRGLPMWQSTFQLAGMNSAAVIDELFRAVASHADSHADLIAALPRPRTQVVRLGNTYGAVILLDAAFQEAAHTQRYLLRFRPAPDSALTTMREYAALPDQPIWRAPGDIAGGRICVQAGVAVGEQGREQAYLFEPWACLPTSEAVQWSAAPPSR